MADLGAMIRDWNCRRLAAALVDYSDGTLAPGGRARVERHLAGCARCAEAVAALASVPEVLRGAAPLRDDAFWGAQRRRVMHALGEVDAAPARVPLRGFDWRLVLPVVAALAIAVAGYLSLRPPATPGEVALDALPPQDLAALVEVAGGLVPPQELLPDLQGDDSAIRGAIEAGWIGVADLPAPSGWGDLDADDLDTLNSMLS